MRAKGVAVLCFVCLAFAGCGGGATNGGASSGGATASTSVRANGNSTSHIHWVKYQDPLEQAFTVEVPDGWVVRGGMFRMGMSDHRPMVDITTQDAKINIRLGDVAVPPFSIPTQFHPPGTIVDIGAVGQPVSEDYMEAPEFAELYGKARFSRLCETLTPTQANMPPPKHAKGDFDEALGKARQQGANPEASDGAATFDCGSVLGRRTAYDYVQTAMLGTTGWIVPTEDSYVAPPDQLQIVRDILDHIEASVQYSPEWQARQDETDRQAIAYSQARARGRMEETYREVQQAQAKMDAMRSQVQSFEAGQARERSQFQGWDDVINNVTPTIDPFGNEHDVTTGSKYGYWYNPGTNSTVNSNTMPGPGYQKLTVIQR